MSSIGFVKGAFSLALELSAGIVVVRVVAARKGDNYSQIRQHVVWIKSLW